MKEEALLKAINKYVQLTKKENEFLLSKINTRKYSKGKYLVVQGDVCNYTSFIISGCTKTFHTDKKGNEHIVLFAEANWWCSDLGSFISKSPADYNIQCIEATEVFEFSYAIREELCEKIPKLDRFFRKILEKALVTSQKRIVRNLSLSAKERYLLFCKEYPTIEQRVSQYMVASYLGITKEFLSKLKKELIYKNEG
ncbi:Crp/Fnr family transcriptional regulator [Aquimarina agarilytica]|uniref:Crp/Fnr family transcriptional regulator n=1 Tax=Aquimarina agarilytica TaxID=1087449 RepID=UPI00028A2DBE|nr:Crp/Fnr family transcriptional regulator [Aquimarina agarilytica]